MGDFRNVSQCPSSFRTVIYTEKVNFLTLKRYFKDRKENHMKNQASNLLKKSNKLEDKATIDIILERKYRYFRSFDYIVHLYYLDYDRSTGLSFK